VNLVFFPDARINERRQHWLFASLAYFAHREGAEVSVANHGIVLAPRFEALTRIPLIEANRLSALRGVTSVYMNAGHDMRRASSAVLWKLGRHPPTQPGIPAGIPTIGQSDVAVHGALPPQFDFDADLPAAEQRSGHAVFASQRLIRKYLRTGAEQLCVMRADMPAERRAALFAASSRFYYCPTGLEN